MFKFQAYITSRDNGRKSHGYCCCPGLDARLEKYHCMLHGDPTFMSTRTDKICEMWLLNVFVTAVLVGSTLLAHAAPVTNDITLSNQPETISLTSTYIIVREEATWEEAFKSCENLGGSLATLPSIKDASRLLEMMKLWGNTDSNGHYWVGAKATESGVEWGWKWLTGEAIPKPSENDQGYSWDKGGIKYAVGNCLVFETAKQDNTRGFCGAHKCDQKHKYICEHKN